MTTHTPWPPLPPIDPSTILGYGPGALAERMGIQFLKLTADLSMATLPVEGNTQPAGRINGGAYGVLGETLASLSAAVHCGPDLLPLGIELNATHTGTAVEGVVLGTCRAISLGRTLTVHEIVVEDKTGKRLSTVRVTNLVVAAYRG